MYTKETLLAMFSYEPDTGLLLWADPKSNRKNAYVNSHSTSNKQYRSVSVGGKTLKVHRVIAAMFLGLDLMDETVIVDHINGLHGDNRLCNLRLTDARGNSGNLETHRNGKLVGTYYNIKSNRWYCRIYFSGAVVSLGGGFLTEEEAAKVHQEAVTFIREWQASSEGPLGHFTISQRFARPET